MLNNPFGNRRIDLPHETIGANLRKFANALSSDGVSLPPAFKEDTLARPTFSGV